MLLALLAGCSSAKRLHKKNTAIIAAKRSVDTYTFKTWPTSAESYEIRLAGVTETSCHLGPDFTVHYFTFPESGILAIYYGGHPQTVTERPTGQFRSAFGTTSSDWSLVRREGGFRAAAYIIEPEREDRPSYTWHLIVTADSENSVHAIVDQFQSFRMIPGANQRPGGGAFEQARGLTTSRRSYALLYKPAQGTQNSHPDR